MDIGLHSLSEESTTWRFEYRIHRGIQTLAAADAGGSMDEFRWQVIPEDRLFTVSDVSASVILPESIAQDQTREYAFFGNDAEEQVVQGVSREGKALNYSTRIIPQGEQLMFVVQWPTGAVHVESPWWVSKVWYVLKYPYYALPVAVLIFLVLWFLKYGRDPKGRGKVIPQYEPPNELSPLHLGALIDEKVRVRFIIALLIDLAQRGYIRIVEEEQHRLFTRQDFTFEKRREFQNDSNLTRVEHFFLESLFEFGVRGRRASVKLSTLKNRFASKINTLRSLIMQDLVNDKYFREHPGRTRFHFYALSGVAAVFGLPVWIVGGIVFQNIGAGAPLFISAVLIFIFAPLMPQKTKKGALAHEWAEGFRLYLHRADQFNVRPLTPRTFNRYLPYAMIFGVEKAWAKAFEQVLTKPPSWYKSSRSFSSFSAMEFSRALSSSFIHATSQTMESVPGTQSTRLRDSAQLQNPSIE